MQTGHEQRDHCLSDDKKQSRSKDIQGELTASDKVSQSQPEGNYYDIVPTLAKLDNRTSG
jgi:hypothetical protein